MKDFKEDTLPLSWAPKYPLGAEILAVGAVCSSPEQDYPWQSWSCVQQGREGLAAAPVPNDFT